MTPPKYGDIVTTSDGEKWTVTRVFNNANPDRRVVALRRCRDHLEMAAKSEAIEVYEEHPGGAGS